MKKKLWSIKDFNLTSKTVLVRVDFNVPFDSNGKISDDLRIRAALPTIKYLLKKKSKIVLMSHLGKPNGFNEKLKMDVVAQRLQDLLKHQVIKLDDCVGSEVNSVVKGLSNCGIVLLENLRFHSEEESNSKEFAGALAKFADFYVDDAFGSIHRSHASIDAITDFVPSCAGFLVEQELKMLGLLLKRPKKPFVAIMGGAKVSDKMKLMEKLVKKVDILLVGGAMMFTFLKSQGKRVGKSFVEEKSCGFASDLLKKNKKIILPVDVVGDVRADETAKQKLAMIDAIPKDFIGLDIGPETIGMYAEILKPAKTIFWNGPLGMCELENFRRGTEMIARVIAQKRAVKIVGGGDICAVINSLKLSNKFTHVSTGGGAALEFLEQGTLPGVIALERSFQKFLKYWRKGAV